MTGHGEESLVAQAARAGAIACIEKPFRADVLLDACFRDCRSGKHRDWPDEVAGASYR